MKLWKIYAILGLLGLPVLLLSVPIGLGWMIGHAVMALLVVARTAFYGKLLSKDTFSAMQFGAYLIFTTGLITIPLLISFFFQDIIQPLAIFAAYLLDRGLHFVYNIFVKEESHAK